MDIALAAHSLLFPCESGRIQRHPWRIRAAAIPYRSNVHGPVDHQINTQHGGNIVYWDEPDGHQWEMLTVSYARQPG